MSQTIIICGSQMHFRLILTCGVDVPLFICLCPICLKVPTLLLPQYNKSENKFELKTEFSSCHLAQLSTGILGRMFPFFIVKISQCQSLIELGFCKHILLSFTSSISWVNSSLLRNEGFQSCLTSQVSFCAVMSEKRKGRGLSVLNDRNRGNSGWEKVYQSMTETKGETYEGVSKRRKNSNTV